MSGSVEMLSARELEAFSSDTAIMTIKEVSADTKLAEPTIYELVRKKKFPASFNLIGRKSVWLKSEVESWKRWRIETAKGKDRWQPPAPES